MSNKTTSLISTQPTPLGEIIEEHMSQVLDELLSSLDQEQGLVFGLYHLYGLSFVQISQQLQMSTIQIMLIYKSAVKNLRRKLEE